MNPQVGNDVVDLRDPRCPGKSEDQRFMDRIFTPREAAAIRRAERPDEALWATWAAKEAAFKVVTKLAGSPPPFRHATFEFLPVFFPRSGAADPAAASDASTKSPVGDMTIEGIVEYRRSGIPVAGVIRPDWIHMLAWYPRGDEPPAIRSRVKHLPQPTGRGDQIWKEGVRDRFTDREWRSIHRPASALARLNARAHLAQVLEVDEGRVEIVCDEGLPGRMPPYVLVSGRRWTGDVSLSHHGRFLAWAFLGPAPS